MTGNAPPSLAWTTFVAEITRQQNCQVSLKKKNPTRPYYVAPGCPGTHYEDQAGLRLVSICVLGL